MYTGMCIARQQIKGLGIGNYDPFFEVHNFEGPNFQDSCKYIQ